MLIATIPFLEDKSTPDLLQRATKTADGIELRLDYSPTLDISSLKTLRQDLHIPLIFTLRETSQGGFYHANQAYDTDTILELASLNPDYIDLSYDVPLSLLGALQTQYPNIKLICSYHDFKQTPVDLITLLKSLEHPAFYAYKIASYANNTCDALRMLLFVKTLSSKLRLTGLCMGDYGQCTRILSPVVGSFMTYACLDEKTTTAPGQLTLDTLLSTYHVSTLNTKTKIYALLGDPVSISVGHILHNKAIMSLQDNAVYVKLQVTPTHLPSVLTLCRDLPFFGFSITMPLKEILVSCLDAIHPFALAIQAINTVTRHQDAFIGCNTDGAGALDALAQHLVLEQQVIVILGSGGAARAIAYEALQRKAKVIILGRTLHKAMALSETLGCEGGALNTLGNLRYSVLINTLPLHAYTEEKIAEILKSGQLTSQVVAMDIVYQPILTPFLKYAQTMGCRCVFGYEMYINQALLQIKLWFNPKTTQLNEINRFMNQYFLTQRTLS